MSDAKRKRRPEITAPLSYLTSLGGSWHVVRAAHISGIAPLVMSEFPSQNHCTLTSLTSIFSYYHDQGFVAIPKDRQVLFQNIVEIAQEGMRFHPCYGTFPWVMPSIAREVWARYGYLGTARGTFFFRHRNSLVQRLVREVDAKRPGMISFTHNQYRDHTVTFTGYRCYVRDDEWHRRPLPTAAGIAELMDTYPHMRVLLEVQNHWIRAPRYVDLEHVGEGRETYVSLCCIHA